MSVWSRGPETINRRGVRTNVGREAHGSHALAEFHAFTQEVLGQFLGFFLVCWLGCYVDSPVRRASKDLEGQTILDLFIDAQKDKLGDVYSRVKVLNLLFLRLFKGVERQHRLDLFVGGMVDLGRRVDDGAQFFVGDKPGRGMGECLFQKVIVVAEEGQAIQWGACGHGQR